jgi:hypothetical protein
MSPQINSSLVFKIASPFYFGLAKGRAKIFFLLWNVSAGKITLYRWQHFASEVRVEWP